MEQKKLIKQKRKRISYRDALSEEFTRDYPFVTFTKGEGPHAFTIWFRQADFGYFDFCKFWDDLGLVDAKYAMRAKDDGILVDVSNYRGGFWQT